MPARGRYRQRAQSKAQKQKVFEKRRIYSLFINFISIFVDNRICHTKDNPVKHQFLHTILLTLHKTE